MFQFSCVAQNLPVSPGAILLRRVVRKPRRFETTRCGEFGPLPIEKLRSFENSAVDSPLPLPVATTATSNKRFCRPGQSKGYRLGACASCAVRNIAVIVVAVVVVVVVVVFVVAFVTSYKQNFYLIRLICLSK
uniref:Uncharacterized protein n=1 Tax=Glossina pallidipes TaxID=7398 RepID=A0A1A9ZL61_GLOPL